MGSMCRNQLLVSGPADEVARFRADARDGDTPLSFNALRPAPPLPERHGHSEFMHALAGLMTEGDSFTTAAGWKIAHWGAIRTDVSPRVCQDDVRTLRYDFYCQPPIALVRFLAATRPSLRFHLAWYDPNAQFAGQLVIADGDESLRESDGVGPMVDVLAGSPLQAEVREYFNDELLDENDQAE